MAELTKEISNSIDLLCELGNELMLKENYEGAFTTFKEALALLPIPKDDWEAWTWLMISMGDARFRQEKFEEAIYIFEQAYKDEPANPFINLRLGQCYWDLYQDEPAKEFLLRAYMWSGEDIFKNEESKYFDWLSDNVKL